MALTISEAVLTDALLLMLLLVTPVWPINATVGKDVLLPCNYDVADWSEKDNVVWKDPKDNTLFSLNPPSQSDRVQTFPDNHLKGNFSILLKKVMLSDSGTYQCHIGLLTRQDVSLNVTEKPAGGAAVTKPWSSFIFTTTTMLVSVLYLPR